jgi:hypothetical protein
MTTDTIFYFAVGVFLLMMIGIFLTMWEFHKLNDTERQERESRSPRAGSLPGR